MTVEVQISQFAKYRFFNSQSTDFSIRKVQISQFAKYRFFNSQSTDFSIRKVQIFEFAKYRFLNSQSTDFSIRKVQISQSTNLQSTISLNYIKCILTGVVTAPFLFDQR